MKRKFYKEEVPLKQYFDGKGNLSRNEHSMMRREFSFGKKFYQRQSSITKNKFFYEKEGSFMRKEFDYGKGSSILRRKFLYEKEVGEKEVG